MRQKIHNFFIGGRNFREEFRRQLRLLIIVAIGFTIAFSWRQTIFDIVQVFINTIFKTNSFSSTFLTSIAITFLGIIVVFLTAHLLKEKSDRY